jgi:hypothetical protein
LRGLRQNRQRRQLLDTQARRFGHLEQTAELNPFRIIWVSPSDIDREPTDKHAIYPKEDRRLARVLGGQWDQRSKSFWDEMLSSALRSRFVDMASWEETPFVIDLLERFKRGEPGPYWHKCRSTDDVRDRCKRVDELFASIAATGFRAPPGVRPQVSGLTTESSPSAIAVAIDREGRFLHLNGRHRLAISKALEIDMIPVRVGIRHAAWQETRRKFGAASMTEQLSLNFNHPDLNYLAKVSSQ